MASGSGWNLWVWLAGGGCGWNIWVWLYSGCGLYGGIQISLYYLSLLLLYLFLLCI